MTRIIGGAVGGRRLAVPKGRGTRPTSDRMREGLFSSLGSDLSDRSFLDLFAGSGAVGLEAASRGAAPVHLVERDPAALAALRANVAAFDLPDVHVHAMAVATFLRQPAPLEADVVFLDPPYADPVDEILATLVDGAWLAPGAVVVVERSSRDRPLAWPGGLVEDRSRRYGEGTLWYGRRP